MHRQALRSWLSSVTLVVGIMALSITGGTSPSLAQPLVIAHRGASGYLPEHTLAAKALAYAMRADYLEQDVVMTKDDQLIVLHDRFLDRVTDVAERFPDRARADGRYYAIDFTLAEIKQLRVSEGFTRDAEGQPVPGFPQRFPLGKADFRIATLSEEIELIQGLNQTLGYDTGIYPEIKAPWFHRREGKDVSRALLAELKKYGYTDKSHKVFVQCFDPHELRRIHDELLPELGIRLRLVQLIAETEWNETLVHDAQGNATPYDYGWMHEPGAMQKVAEVADGIGPWLPHVVRNSSTAQQIQLTPLVGEAHRAGLVVHPYTFRADPGQLPPYAQDLDALFEVFCNTAGVDGLFTDFPDKAVQFLSRPRAK